MKYEVIINDQIHENIDEVEIIRIISPHGEWDFAPKDIKKIEVREMK